MKTIFISYFEPDVEKKIIEYACAKELLLMYFRDIKMSYYSNPEDGGSFQLYCRLKRTQFSLQQCIYVKGFKYLCRTTVAEIRPKRAETIAKLQDLVGQMNHTIDIGKFVFDTRAVELQFHDGIRINPATGAINLKALFDNFDRLVSWPRFLVDVEYGDILFDIKNGL